MYIYMYIHTYIHTYIHAYIHTYIYIISPPKTYPLMTDLDVAKNRPIVLVHHAMRGVCKRVFSTASFVPHTYNKRN